MKSQAARTARPRVPAREGVIGSNTIPYLIRDLANERATGFLTLADGDITKTLQFRDGRLLFASSNQRDDRLSAFLMREGVLPLKSLMKALEVMLATKDRLGEVMVKWKMLTSEEVEQWVRVQVREIAYSVFHWQRGRFAFEAKEPPQESITAGDSGVRLVFEGVRRIASWVRAYEELGGMGTELLAGNQAAAIGRELDLDGEARKILDLCEQPMTLEELCDASTLKDFDVCKTVWALLIVGALMKS